MIVIPIVFKSAITRRSTRDVRPTDVFEFVGPADLFMEEFYLFKKILSYYFTDGVVA
ncbi:MAG: hypothetical protein NVS2B12_16450 [Ktedonobacteraceae bacterium]